MNICFISNFSKTFLFKAVAASLHEKGINAYWIACNQKLYNQLVKEYGENRVLLINRSFEHKEQEPIGDFKINELIFGDRILRHDFDKGIKFLTHIQQPIFNFLSNNKVEKIFGEVTWAHEILIHRMCTQLENLDCQFLNPHVIRIPDQRFAFFTDEKQSKFFQIDHSLPEAIEKIVPKPPSYLKINHKMLSKASSLKGKLDRLKRFITRKNIDPLDPCLMVDTRDRLKTGVREEWRRWQYRLVKKSEHPNLEKTAYLFLGLHKQPEASVDVLGRYYENQYQNIVNLWRTLPPGWSFLIKEHSVAIGDRPLAFYRKIQALPGVILINEQLPSYEFLKNANLVATVTGTIAYEAALMGVPAITFVPCFFNKLNRCQKIGLKDLDENNLQRISEDLYQKPENIDTFSRFVYSHTYAGNVLDPVSDPAVLSNDNVADLTSAYTKVLTRSKLSPAVA